MRELIKLGCIESVKNLKDIISHLPDDCLCYPFGVSAVAAYDAGANCLYIDEGYFLDGFRVKEGVPYEC